MKVGMVQAGARPPFPMVLHMHAVLMGSFLLLLLAQTLADGDGPARAAHAARDRSGWCWRRRWSWSGSSWRRRCITRCGTRAIGPPAVAAGAAPVLPIMENILLLQIADRDPVPAVHGDRLKARERECGLHKRMMFLATAMPLGRGDRPDQWLPTTLPASPMATDLYMLLAVSPMFVWDVIRNRRVHEAYWIWFAAIFVVAAIAVDLLWDTPGWHATAKADHGRLDRPASEN